MFVIQVRRAREMLRTELERELSESAFVFNSMVKQKDEQRQLLSSAPPIASYLRAAVNGDKQTAPDAIPRRQEIEALVEHSLTPHLSGSLHFATITAFDRNRQQLFVAERPNLSQGPVIKFRRAGVFDQEFKPDDRVWTGKPGENFCDLVDNRVSGKTLRCVTPVANPNEPNQPTGALVTDVNLGSLCAGVAGRLELARNDRHTAFAVLDKSGAIVHHTNKALTQQQVEKAFGEFAPIAKAMTSGAAGVGTYRSSSGAEWLAAYGPSSVDGIYLAVARDMSLMIGPTYRAGWIGVGLAVFLGVGMATVFTLLYQRRLQTIDRVTEGVAAIAKGELDRHIDARSRDDIRPLAESVNLVTRQLREQLAREAENRQFQSFVKLSAILTHDLKNAIGALSLLVANMEHHFANEEFRADAMKSLTSATEKLKALVERISNPVATLSGEFKRPEPVDLVPVIKRVVAGATISLPPNQRVLMNVPESLIAMADGERIERVIENLVLNALEAMTTKPGTLTIEAGPLPPDSVFFKVADTGVGMSDLFLNEKLFHAFATTKRHGMGLGLYTCREVVQANGGTIEVQSKQGDGTTVRVVLPSPAINE